MYNLRNRHFLKLLDFTPKDIKFLLELSIDLRSDSFTLVNLPDRLRRLPKDPWAEYGATKQRLTKAMRHRLA